MDSSNEEIGKSFKQVLRVNDIYNIIVNKRSSERHDVLESIATLIAIFSDEAGSSLENDSYVAFMEPIVRTKILEHYSSQYFETTEVFFKEAIKIASNPILLNEMENKLELKQNELVRFQRVFISNLLTSFNSLKIEGVGVVSLENFGIIEFRKTGSKEISCDEINYVKLESIIDLLFLPVSVVLKQKNEDYTWFLGGSFNETEAFCSDNDCPCSQDRIYRNEGYLCVYESQGVKRAVLSCEVGARKRNLDLIKAHQNAKNWWKNGRVPFDITPINYEQQIAPYKPSISELEQKKYINDMLEFRRSIMPHSKENDLKPLDDVIHDDLINKVMSYSSYYSAGGIENGIHGPEMYNDNLYISIYHYLQFKGRNPNSYDTFKLGGVLSRNNPDYRECKYKGQSFSIKKFNLKTIFENENLIEQFLR
jgi:hypothetical protein